MIVGRALADVGGVDPHHRALLVADGGIIWAGADPANAPPPDEVVDLGAAWLTPGFTDAHVHATATGLQRAGIDLTPCRSAADVLAEVRAQAARTDGRVVYGAGWDDLRWDRRPTARELADAAPGRLVLLLRVDGHSCLVDVHTLDHLDLRDVAVHVDTDADGAPTGWLLEAASAVAQSAMRAELTADDLAAARTATCDAAAALGITTIHEMGIPALPDVDDAMAWATGTWPITVHAYWADLEIDPTGPLRPGGDLFLDGSIGSCTAATHGPYRTGEGGEATGELFCDDDAVGAFFTRATRAGVGAGVHAIGDRAVGQALRAISAAADACGLAAVRAARHRIEHVEMISRSDVTKMARLAVTASVQPAFDAIWNGPGGLYEQRFGREAADITNPFAWFAEAGVELCLSSDSTVTPLDPWGGVLAAGAHHGGLGIDRRRALEAATIGGHRAVGAEGEVGALTAGRRADVVAWPGDPLTEDPRGWRPIAVMARGRWLRSP
ncbi:amidohydrolase [soil metagenome]